VQRLENRFALLTAGSRTARLHQRTLRAAIDWSWELCSPAERLLWARLSVFAGSFTLDAAEGGCAGGEITASEVVDLLDWLVAQSLVEHAGDGSGVPRYPAGRPRRGHDVIVDVVGAENSSEDRVNVRHR